LDRSLVPFGFVIAALGAGCGLSNGGNGSSADDGSPQATSNTPTPSGSTDQGPGARDAGGTVTPPPHPTDDAGADTPPVPPPPPPPPPGPAPIIPSPSGVCPPLSEGTVTFSPAGIAPRAARVWMSDAAAQLHGPLVFYWHADRSTPAEAAYTLGNVIATIRAAGGIVIAPAHDPQAGDYTWYLLSGDVEDDLRVADEALACAMQTVGVDPRHVHSLGMSAGGVQSTRMSFTRARYLASVATLSGGLFAPAPAYEMLENKYPAMIVHGGPSDNAFGFDFQAASGRFQTKLAGDGHFTFACNHGRGHVIPLDAAAGIWSFFGAHPFGVASPYAGGLPADIPAYCKL
jgi:hypothetical protein